MGTLALSAFTELVTATDSTFSAGKAGIRYFANQINLDNWECGDA